MSSWTRLFQILREVHVLDPTIESQVLVTEVIGLTKYSDALYWLDTLGDTDCVYVIQSYYECL